MSKGFVGWLQRIFTEEVDDSADTLTPDEIEQLLTTPLSPAPEQSSAAAPPPQTEVELPAEAVSTEVGDALDFDAIYKAASIETDGMASAEKALEIIRSQPQDLTLEVKRASVKATLKALGVPIDEIKRDVMRKSAALNSYHEQFETSTTEQISADETAIGEIEAEIEAFLQQKNDEIASLKTRIQERRQHSRQIEDLLRNREEDMRIVVEFFTSDSVSSSSLNPESPDSPPEELDSSRPKEK